MYQQQYGVPWQLPEEVHIHAANEVEVEASACQSDSALTNKTLSVLAIAAKQVAPVKKTKDLGAAKRNKELRDRYVVHYPI